MHSAVAEDFRQPACGLSSSLLEEYATEAELVAVTGKGHRTWRLYRQRRMGPPWVKMGNTVLYPRVGFKEWLRSHQIDPAADKARRR